MKADVCFFRRITLPSFCSLYVCVVDDLAVAYKDTQLVDQRYWFCTRPRNSIRQQPAWVKSPCKYTYNGIQVVFGLAVRYLPEPTGLHVELRRRDSGTVQHGRRTRNPPLLLLLYVNCPLS